MRAWPVTSSTIEVRVGELRQLFHSIDPSPFHQRDLDPRAEEFIVDWAKEFPRDAPLRLKVHLNRAPGPVDETDSVRDAVHQYFGARVATTRRRLRELFRRGRLSLTIGLTFLGASIIVGDAVVGMFRESRFAEVIREGLLIGGWVAMWRPLEIFLYDWWPIRAEARLFDRLSAMPVEIAYSVSAPEEPSRVDWPAPLRT
jgi:hypothetical protein